MSQRHVSLRQRAVDLLVSAGTWVPRSEFAALSSSTLAVDDTLADLVVEGKAEWRERAGYRLVGTLLARRAAELQRRSGKRAVLLGEKQKERYCIAVAEQHEEPVGLVMYELELPVPADPWEALAMYHAVADRTVNFVESRERGTS